MVAPLALISCFRIEFNSIRLPLANDHAASIQQINAICSATYVEEFAVIPKRPEDFDVAWFNDVLELGGEEVIGAKVE